ncbi:TetR/AcrR family transcriptional regulator [Curtobacterium sp. ZW137]|uniref:TetR/AcrR family transcriptional regulator n=1 Tax=Curtobacterium sp. ZW137 TaxID=2485104 RepID=UPI001617EA8A|nr:TetR/AcrR family transcriptional regulator [Curtobacterium sp. ZW137]
MSETTPRAPRRDVLRNRAAIVDSACTAFAERGLDAPLEPIAAAAGVGNATLYRHFPERAALWEAVLQAPLQEVLDLMRECLARSEDDPWAGFATFIRRTADIEARREGFSELMTTRFTGAPTLLALRAEIQAGLESLFRRAQDAGAVRADAALEDVAVVQLSMARTIETFGDVAPELHRRWVDLMLDGFRAPGADREPLGGPPLRPNQIWRAVMRRR